MHMQPGGGIVLGGQRRSIYQASHPDQANYVTVGCSRAGSRLERTEPWAVWRGIYLSTDVLAYRLQGDPLQQGDTITVTYGERREGGPGMQVQSFSNDRVILPLYVDLEGEGTILTPGWPAFQVIGQPTASLASVVVPSIVATGEQFEVVVRSEDKFKNLASGTTGSYEVLLNDRPWREIPSGSDALVVLTDVRLDESGVYRFQCQVTRWTTRRLEQSGLGPGLRHQSGLLGRYPRPHGICGGAGIS